MLRYWIGSTGTTTDTAHWSDTSGGSGGFSVPTISDDVIFDTNSIIGSNKTVTASNLQCATLTISIISISCDLTGTITCAGDVYRAPGTYMSTSGVSLTLDGAGGNITNNSSTNIVWANLTMLSGTWNLQDTLKVNTSTGNFRLESGTFNSNNNAIYCNIMRGNNDVGLVRNINFGTSIISISGQTLQFSGNQTNLALTDYTIKISSLSTPVIINTDSVFGVGNLKYVEILGTIPLDITMTAAKIKKIKVINSTNTYGTIITFTSNKTNIIDEIVGTATVNYPIYFKSSSITQTYTISPTTNLVLDRYAISGCIATGAGITANNSVDEGQNTDVVFNNPLTITKYWVGGSGKGNELTHWSNTSGGPSGTTKPIYKYNVRFDVNSFTALGQTVDLSGSLWEITCRNMDWTGALYNPTFKGKTTTSQCVNAYGSVTFIPDMITVVGTNTVSIVFNGIRTGLTFTSAGKTLNTITFSADASAPGYVIPDYTLQDNVTCTGSFLHSRGNLNTNDKTIWCNTFDASLSPGVARTLNLGASTINYKTSFSTTGGFLTVNAGTSTIKSYVVGLLPAISTFSSKGHTFNNVELAGKEDWIFATYGASTFKNLKIVIPSGLVGNKKFYIGASLTGTTGIYIIDSLTGDGTPTNNIELLSSPATGANYHFISKASGIVSVKYWNISRSHAIGGAAFYAIDSTDSGLNTGWIFGAPPSTGTGIYYGDIPIIAVYKGSTLITAIYKGTTLIQP